MNALVSGSKFLLSTLTTCLNTPGVKEGVKNVAGVATFAFGIFEAYDLIQIITCKREISSITPEGTRDWATLAYKIAVICAKLSIILSAGVSRPGLFIISSIFGQIFSTEQLESVFGLNTIFAINPWHPRHIASIAATVLALPILLHTCFTLCREGKSAQNGGPFITDAKVKFMDVFNFLTSRPTLHLGNQFCRFLLRP
jgi:hypothetical protein